MPNEQNDWNVWSHHVLKELERLNESIIHLDKELREISVEIMALRVKSGMWGIIGGALPAVIALLYFLWSR